MGRRYLGESISDVLIDAYLQKTRSEWNLKPEQQIAGEIRMLRRLATEGVISQKIYEEAKDKLFSRTHKTSQSAA